MAHPIKEVVLHLLLSTVVDLAVDFRQQDTCLCLLVIAAILLPTGGAVHLDHNHVVHDFMVLMTVT